MYSNMSQYEVTIGIPVYNIERYVTRMMESALAQTFTSIEFLVLDDCGTDGSIDIVRSYQQRHPRGRDIRIVRQPRNMGLGQARNRIVAEARGRYLYHLDGDDTIAPNAIELLYAEMRRHNAQLVYGSYERVYEDGSAPNKPCVYPYRVFTGEGKFAHFVYAKYDALQANTWNFLIDIAVYRDNHIGHQPVNFWEDFTFTMDLPTYVTRVVMLPQVTYSYYMRENTLSNIQRRDHIAKEEILKTVRALEAVKANSGRIKDKTYFPMRLYKVMMTDFYVVCSILHHRSITEPPFTPREIRDVMSSPLTFAEVVRLRQWRARNLMLYALSVLPPRLSVACMWAAGKLRHLI